MIQSLIFCFVVLLYVNRPRFLLKSAQKEHTHTISGIDILLDTEVSCYFAYGVEVSHDSFGRGKRFSGLNCQHC